MKSLYILSGNASQAANYCRGHKVPLHEAVYVYCAAQLRGLRDPVWVVTGTFWDRARSIDIWEALCRTQTSAPQAPPELQQYLKKMTKTTLGGNPALTATNAPSSSSYTSSGTNLTIWPAPAPSSSSYTTSSGTNLTIWPSIPNPTPPLSILDPMVPDVPLIKKRKKFKSIRP